MNGATCGSCRYWDAPENTVEGLCRRRPPQMVELHAFQPYTENMRPNGFTQAQWPVTTGNDWCGEYQPAEPQQAEAAGIEW